MNKETVKNIIFFIAGFSLIYASVDKENLSIPNEFLITTPNTIDSQVGNECSGYAAAYVLRTFGVNVDGSFIYSQIQNKNEDGTVPPKALTKYINDFGFNAKIKNGSIKQLKKAISKGTPIIVFVRVVPESPYFHYLPIVGYNEQGFWVSDSLDYMKTHESEFYNRFVSYEEMELMWETNVEQKNTYIVIGK